MSIDAAFCLCYDKRWLEDSGPIDQLTIDVKDYLGLDLQLFWAGAGDVPEIDYDHIDIPKEQCAQFLYQPAEHSQKGHANAFLCHRKILQRCLNYERVLLLEDDAYFLTKRWKSLSKEGLDFIQNGDYNGLYLGWQGRENEFDSDDMDRIERRYSMFGKGDFARCEDGGPRISGFHAIILNNELMEELWLYNQGPMDTTLQTYAVLTKNNLCYMRPKIIGSRAGFSHCEQKYQERSILS